jgi:hypothetical protein
MDIVPSIEIFGDDGKSVKILEVAYLRRLPW